MDTFIATTFMIILAFAALNALVSVILYATSKRQIYARAALFWTALVVNFIIQSRAQEGELTIIWGFGFSLLPVSLMAYASLFFRHRPYPKLLLGAVTLGSAGLTFALANTNLSFTIKALPFSAALAMIALYTAYEYLRPNPVRLTALMKVHAVVLILMAVHGLDFAFFRMAPSAQLWGWPVAYALYQITAVLFPAMTLDFMHAEEQSRLKTIIDQRTAELVTANADLRALYRQKDFLFKTLTHDISNPLTVIHTKAMMPQLCLANPAKFVDEVRLMTDRMASLIHQVRDFDLFESRLEQLPKVDLNVLDLIDEVRHLFEDRLGQKSLRLMFDPAACAALSVRVEASSFQSSVLPNLISNAIKFSPAGSTIRIGATAVPPDRVSLSVEDAGSGIPAELVSRLFEFGQNTSRLGTAGERGSGFGLPILSRVVKAYGGEVHVHTRVQTADLAGMTRMELVLPGSSVEIKRAG